MTRIYFIGNSVTDTINYRGLDNIAEGQSRSHEWGRHMIPGAPLGWIWNNSSGGIQEPPYGYYRNALTQYQWDALSLQPYDRSLEGPEGDLAMANNFINLAKTRSPNLQVYIYQRWPRIQNNNPNPTADDWDAMWLATYSGGNGAESRSYYDLLAQGLRSAHPDLPPIQLVRVGEVFYALNQRMKSGQVPGYSSVWQLYTDHVHLNNIGSYIVGATYYATLYRSTPQNTPIPSDYGTVPAAIAQVIQQTVWDVVSTERSPGSSASPPPPANPMFLLADTTVTEGQDRTAQITVSLSRASSDTVTVSYSTADGTASQGSDYTATSGILIFAPGQTSQTISVEILADSTPEATESFTVNFSNPTGGSVTLGDTQATVTIGDVIQSAVSTTLPEGIRNLVLIGDDPISGTGNNGDNSITGNSNQNTLDGRAGYDTLQGGTGNDTYIVESIAWDLVIEAENAGVDTVQATGNFTLPAHVEHLTLIGNEDANATGNGIDNRLEGNPGNNVLDGGDGKDILEGKTGNDTYVVNSPEDTIIEAANHGTDAVQATVSYGLSEHIENLTLLGRANLSGRGNELNNRIGGNPGSNQLTGGGGQDMLLGAEGNDTLVGEADQDWLNGGAGADQLLGGAGADRFVYAGASQPEAMAQSTLGSLDQITNFSRRSGDRIQLDFDNNLATSDLPKSLFNAGRLRASKGRAGVRGRQKTARTLVQATQTAYQDKNQRAKGRQSLQVGEAVSFGWRGQTYLSVNAGGKGFGATEDLLVQLSGGSLGGERGKLTVSSVFA